MPTPFQPDGEHIGISLPGARVRFTTRRGGYSRGPYASLNLGLLTEDDPTAVRANRAAVEGDLGLRLAWGRQVHGTAVAVRDAPGPGGAADAQVTSAPDIAPMVLSADCLTIALAAPGVAGVIHAGWRGLADGVIPAGVAAARARAAGAPVHAAIGPGAGVCCYEVGDEVRDRFARYGAAVKRERNLDLKAIATSQLADAGVAEVHDVGLCTICGDPGLFFSHRRDGGVTGRQAAIAWLSG
jgi:YfiH family protein